MGFRITIKFDDNAKKFQRKAKRMASRLPREMERATDEIRKMLEQAVKDQISNEHGLWPSLRPFTLAYKARHGMMMGKLKATGKLRNSIEGWKTGMYSGYVSVGGGGYPRGRSVRQVAMWHERGTSRMQARPIFKPVYWKKRQEVLDIYKTALMRALA